MLALVWFISIADTHWGVPVPAWPDQPLFSGARELWDDAAWLVVLELARSNHMLEAVKTDRKVSGMATHPCGRRDRSGAPVLPE